MRCMQLDLSNDIMMAKLLPLYQEYEAEISNAMIEEIFPKDQQIENINYFKKYFSRGITTFVYSKNNCFIGFISFHVDSKEVPGYANGYEGWGHLAEIYTSKDMRRKGIGKSMVEDVENEFLKVNINKIYLTDLSGKKLFWESLGYTDTNKIEPNEGGTIFEKYLS